MTQKYLEIARAFAPTDCEKSELSEIRCNVPGCVDMAERIELDGQGLYTHLCAMHAAELHERASADPVMCRECDTVIPGSASLCAACGTKHSRLVAYALTQGAVQAPPGESATR